jgi:hypothetical protein
MNQLRHNSLFLLLLSLAGCSTISNYDQAAYANATSLKVDVNNLVGKANESYTSHAKEVSDLSVKLNKAYEYDKGRPLNEKTLQLWELLLVEKADDPDSGIYSRFIHLWQKQGSISPAAIFGKQQRISLAFDQIIGLESGKNK